MLALIIAATLGVAIGSVIADSFFNHDTLDAFGFGFLIALVPLTVMSSFLQSAARATQDRKAIARAREHGRIAAARILHARQTGTRVNDQPVLELSLLIASYPEAPFRATVREAVQQLRLADLRAGNMVSVAHPDPLNDAVILLDDPPDEAEIARFETSVEQLDERPRWRADRPFSPWIAPFPQNASLQWAALLMIFGCFVAGVPLVASLLNG